ncbi:hypothetical protein NE237_016812 [Protea cynaroides]|uniref:RING-type domain-containing protein n=1 Tax=Protea cynaroides TaxID=273540 RepID=A0A9Q0HEV7_9MAGN|nr:hypothetical protein NE237_016812 [Protea cynaroides]
MASPQSSSNDNMNQVYQAPAFTFILVSLLPLVYCILWCAIHIAILDLKRRRQSVSTSDTSALPLQVSVEQLRQQHQQVVCSINRKGEPNQECPICLEEAEEAEGEAETEAISWQLVPECNHEFHELCLNRWLKLSQTCPLCRVTTQLEACAAVV